MVTRLTTKGGRLYVPLGTKKAAQTSVNHENYVEMYNKLADLEDILEGHSIETLKEFDGLLWYAKQIKKIEDELGVDLVTFFNNYRELLSLKGRNLKISIEEVQKQLEQFDKHN